MNDFELEEQKWREVLEIQHGVSWNAPFSKLKYKYENAEWQKVETNLDMFKDMDHVKTICGDGLNCWLDAYHQSLMNKSPITHDIYQFISHRAGIVRDGIKNEIANFRIDWDAVLGTILGGA
jgi:hypothetical protein